MVTDQKAPTGGVFPLGNVIDQQLANLSQTASLLQGPEHVPAQGVLGVLQAQAVAFILERCPTIRSANNSGEAMMLRRTSAYEYVEP